MAKGIVLAAVVTTLALVLVAFFAVNAIESSRVNSINESVLQIYLDSALLDLYSSNGDYSQVYCESISDNVYNVNKLLGQIEYKLNSYNGDLRFSQSYVDVKRNYLITNLILLDKFEKLKTNCGLKTPILIYFYSEEGECGPKCNTIVNQLDSIDSNCVFWGFSFPFNSEKYSLTKLVESKYGITSVGSIVINGVTYSDLLSSSTLNEKLGCAN
jgi:hypothetical protein